MSISIVECERCKCGMLYVDDKILEKYETRAHLNVFVEIATASQNLYASQLVIVSSRTWNGER